MLRRNANALWQCSFDFISGGADVHVPRQEITREELFDYARQLECLPVQVDLDQVPERAFREILALAARYQLTTYDAAYFELAQPLDKGVQNRRPSTIKVGILNP